MGDGKRLTGQLYDIVILYLYGMNAYINFVYYTRLMMMAKGWIWQTHPTYG